MTLKVFNDAATMQQAFEGNEIDLMFGLPPEAAEELLKKAGYEKNSDGIYEKDGETLSIHMVTYSARADLLSGRSAVACGTF